MARKGCRISSNCVANWERAAASVSRYHAFDLLYLDGYDLREVPFVGRKDLLKRLLSEAPETFVYVDDIEADGEEIFANACKMGLEGLVAKQADSPYRSGRQDSWIKLKCKKSETFPIVAFVEKLGAHPRRVASLYVGGWDGSKLMYAGKVRTGYTEASARELRERLDPLIRKTSPLSVAVKKPKATWVEPELDAEVEYGALTDDGLLREAVYKGFRDDLNVPKVKAPGIAPGGGDRRSACRAKTSCSFCPMRSRPRSMSSPITGRGSGRRHCPIWGVARSSWCAMCTEPRSTTRARSRPTFPDRSISSGSANARVAKERAYGSTISSVSSGLLRSAPSNSILGTRRWTTSSTPTGSSSTSIQERACRGTPSSKPRCARAT
jgi:hypothetical protein